ncbi:MAG: DEAD/DEAH box helicase [Spirochaetota bacterium]
MHFKNLTRHDPYPHQIATYEALARGESVILRAPTGSGKSEAVFVPFVELNNK